MDALRDQQARQRKARAAAGEDVWTEGADLVFTDGVGRGVNPWGVSAGFRVLATRAVVKPVPFHALRHSWATLALTSGVPLKIISDNLGHATIAVTAAFYGGIVPEGTGAPPTPSGGRCHEASGGDCVARQS